MNGIHDMGGMDGFGPVRPEKNEPVFHARWESRVFAMTAAVPFVAPYVDDQFRREVERMAPLAYLEATYYERWLHALESLLLERGVLKPGELEARIGNPAAAAPAPLDPGAARPAAVPAAIASGTSTRRSAAEIAGRFRVGDAVVVRNDHLLGHTRAPRYVRGCRGAIHRDHGVFVFADSNARGEGERPQNVYSVRFPARELWGAGAALGESLFIDLWDDYLDPA